MKKSSVPKPPIDVKGCADFLGVSERDVKQMIRIGFLEAKKEGKLTLFDLTQLLTLRRAMKGRDKNKILKEIFEGYNVKLPKNYAFDRDASHRRRMFRPPARPDRAKKFNGVTIKGKSITETVLEDRK